MALAMSGRSSRRRNSFFWADDALSLVEDRRDFFLVADWDLPRLGGLEVDRDRGIAVCFIYLHKMDIAL
jgi:hypothetical protein